MTLVAFFFHHRSSYVHAGAGRGARLPHPPGEPEEEARARTQRPRPGPALRAGVVEPGHGPPTARRVCLPAEPLLSLRVPAHLCLLVARHAVPEAVEEDCRLRLEDRGAEGTDSLSPQDAFALSALGVCGLGKPIP